MGFLQKVIEQQAASVPATPGADSFLCNGCDRVTRDPDGLASSLCSDCRPKLESARLYPVQLIWTLAVTTGPFTAGTLAALNWKRVGKSRKARNIVLQMLALLLGVLFVGPAVFLPPVPAAGLIWLIIVATFIGRATAGLGPILFSQRAVSAKRANILVPIAAAITLAIPASLLWFRMVRHRFGL